ncbi:MAG: hypothetical protein H6922_00155 [Pseudomonadaceae bacterium]|nr:hypothetical protein [Pseudomonadaceae bacterium]
MSRCPHHPDVKDQVGKAFHDWNMARRQAKSPSQMQAARTAFTHANVLAGYPDATIQLTGIDGSNLWWSPAHNCYLLVAKEHIRHLTREDASPTWVQMHADLRAASPGLEER